MTTLDAGGFDAVIACLLAAVLIGNLVLARRWRR